jgi:hypothetical protein
VFSHFSASMWTFLTVPQPPYMQDIKRKFNTVLDLGSGPGHFSKLLELKKTKKSIMVDSSGNFPRFIF